MDNVGWLPMLFVYFLITLVAVAIVILFVVPLFRKPAWERLGEAMTQAPIARPTLTPTAAPDADQARTRIDGEVSRTLRFLDDLRHWNQPGLVLVWIRCPARSDPEPVFIDPRRDLGWLEDMIGSKHEWRIPVEPEPVDAKSEAHRQQIEYRLGALDRGLTDFHPLQMPRGELDALSLGARHTLMIRNEAPAAAPSVAIGAEKVTLVATNHRGGLTAAYEAIPLTHPPPEEDDE